MLDDLLKQFKEEKGLEHFECSEDIFDELETWIESRKLYVSEYAQILSSENFKFDNSNCAEVGMCDVNTVVRPYDTKLITTEPVTGIYKDRIIKGVFSVYNANPYVISRGKREFIPSDVINTYMTQNPSSLNETIRNFTALHNESYNVILGVYGNIHDSNKNEKLSSIKRFGEKLNSGYKTIYENAGDRYYAIVGSKQKVLSKSYK